MQITPQASGQGQVAIAFASLRARITAISTVSGPSAEAMQILAHTAASTRLSPDEKRTIARLAAVVDQFGGAQHGKLMRDLAGVVQLMESAHPEGSFAPQSLASMIKTYMEERAKPEQDQGWMLSAEVEIRAVMAYHQASIPQPADSPLPSAPQPTADAQQM